VGVKKDFAGRRGIDALGLSLHFSAREPAAFRATLAATSVVSADVYRISASGFRCERTAELLDRSSGDLVHFVYVEDGTLTVTVDGRSRMLAPGDLVVLGDGFRYALECDELATVVSVRLPLDDLLVSRSRIDRAMTEPIPPSPLTAAYGAYARALSEGVPDEGSVEARLLARSLVELCRAVLAATLTREPTDPHSIRVSVRRYVEDNLHDPALDLSSVARGVSISRRRLHRLFEGESPSIAGLIRERRVERLREHYVNGGMTFAAASAVAGFGSVATAYRAFRSHHGVAPSDYLEASRTAAR
jgi:AraC-like DNA-binding protein